MKRTKNTVALNKVRRTETLSKVEHEGAEKVHVSEADLVKESSRITSANIPEFISNGGKSLFPRNFDPLRIDIQPFLRIGSLHRGLNTVCVIGVLKDCLTFRAKSAFSGRAVRVAHDFNGDAVLNTIKVRAGSSHAHAAVAIVPAVFHFGVQMNARELLLPLLQDPGEFQALSVQMSARLL